MSDGGFAPAGATRGLCARPLDPFAVHTPMLWGFIFLCYIEHLTRTAGSPDKHADTVCSRYQLNRAEGSREELPWVPPINTRAHYAVALNPIARRVSRGSKTLRGCRAEPCRSPEAEPLAPPLYTKNSYFPCKSTKFEPEFRLNSGGFFFECVLYYMNEGSVRCKTDRNQTPLFRNDDAGEVGIVE